MSLLNAILLRWINGMQTGLLEEVVGFKHPWSQLHASSFAYVRSAAASPRRNQFSSVHGYVKNASFLLARSDAVTLPQVTPNAAVPAGLPADMPGGGSF